MSLRTSYTLNRGNIAHTDIYRFRSDSEESAIEIVEKKKKKNLKKKSPAIR